MKLQFTIVLLLSLTYSFSIGQTRLPINVFHKRFQTCSGFSTTIQDYVIKLYNDSTIEILYYSSGGSYDRFLSKTTFTGKYFLNTDTIIVSYLTGFTETKYKYNKNADKYLKPAGNLIFYPSTTFVVNGKMIISISHWFPDLETSFVSETNSLEYEFLAWRNYYNRENKIRNLPVYHIE